MRNINSDFFWSKHDWLKYAFGNVFAFICLADSSLLISTKTINTVNQDNPNLTPKIVHLSSIDVGVMLKEFLRLLCDPFAV